MNAKLSLKAVCFKKEIFKTFPMIPCNLYVRFKSASCFSGLWLIPVDVDPNPH